MSAPKQLVKRQRLERKRRRKHETLRRRQREWRTGSRASGFCDPLPVFSGPMGGIKMSTVLEEFVEPLTDQVEGHKAYARAISMGIVAWNAALEPESRRAAFVSSAIDAALENPNDEDRLRCREVIEHLIARKLRCFAQYRRPILGYHLDELEDGGLFLSVISAVT